MTKIEVNTVCICGNPTEYVTKQQITHNMVRRHDDAFCIDCLSKLIRANVTKLAEWKQIK